MQVSACLCVGGVSEHMVMSVCVTHNWKMGKHVFTAACVSLECVGECRVHTSAHACVEQCLGGRGNGR